MNAARAPWLVPLVVLALASVGTRGAAAEQPARITVLGPGGGALAGARLVVASARLDGHVLVSEAAPTLARSDERGRIGTWDRERVGDGRLVLLADGLAGVLLPAARGPATVRLMPARASDGLVRLGDVGAAAGRPVVARCRERGADLAYRVTTDARGRYRFAHLHAGDWDLFLQHAGGRLQRIGRVRAGASLGETRLAGATSLEGAVFDADGSDDAAVPDVTLRFVGAGAASEAATAEVRTRADGAFRVEGLPPGVYEVLLVDEAWAFEARRPRVQIDPGRARALDPWFALRRQAVTGRVEDADEHPLQGVEVRLVADPTRAPLVAGAEAATPVVRTDERGRFKLTAVVPGEGYRLVASAVGYSPWASLPFDVDRGAVTALDPVRLRPGWRVLVRVRDLDGDPVAGAEVRAVAARRPTAARDALWSAMARAGTTDAAGLVELVDLPGDDALVEVGAPGFLATHTLVDYPRVSDRRRADVTLHRAAALTGQVLRGEGGAAGPYVVRAWPRDGRPPVEAATDGAGRFRLESLARTGMDVHVAVAADDGERLLATVENVLPGVEEHLEILLPAVRSVRGSVDDLELYGPPAEAVAETQRFDPSSGRYVWRVAARARVEVNGRQGRFRLAGLAPGLYAVRVVQGALDTGTRSVVLEQEDVEGLAFRLPSGARIAGTVLDEESEPLLGAQVRLTRWHGEDAAHIRAPDALQQVTDERGDFLFTGLADGLWRVEARDVERAPDVVFARIRDGEVRVVRDLRLSAGGALRGRLEDPDGRPLDAVGVRVLRFDGDEPERSVRTDAEGVFQARNLRPGTYQVLVHALTVAGGPWVEALAEVEAGSTTEVRFTAAGEGTIAGLVTRSGRAVSGAVVDLVHTPYGTGPVRRYRASTDLAGRFELGQLDPGRYEVLVQSGALRRVHDIELGDGERRELELEAFEARLRGTVLDRGGDPVAGATVEALPLGEDGRPDRSAGYLAEGRTDPRGAFVLRGLPVGAYALSVSAAGHPPGVLRHAEADLPGADFEVEVVLGRGGDIALHVVDENDRGVTGALVWLETRAGEALNRRAYVTGAAGRLRIEGVPTGAVRVRVRARGLGRPALHEVAVEEGRAVALQVRLQPGGAIELTVTGAGADPLPRARIDIVRPESGEVLASRRPLSPIRLAAPWGWVPRTGVVRIPDLETGTYLARIRAGRGYRPAEVPISVESGRTSAVRVTLEPSGR